MAPLTMPLASLDIRSGFVWTVTGSDAGPAVAVPVVRAARYGIIWLPSAGSSERSGDPAPGEAGGCGAVEHPQRALPRLREDLYWKQDLSLLDQWYCRP